MFSACDSSKPIGSNDVVVLNPPVKTIKLFGFAVVDCGWDDPNDTEVKTNFVDEVSGFTNSNQMCVYSPHDDIEARISLFAESNMRAILYIESIFFEQVIDLSTPSGTRLVLMPDAKERWQNFVGINSSVLTSEFVDALYIADEPVWNGMAESDFTDALQIIKDTLPSIPTLSIEAYPVINQVMLPLNLDWVGFDRYDSAEPDTDQAWLADLATLKNARTRVDQKIVIVASSQWLPFYETDAGITQEDVEDVIQSYYRVATSDPDIIALIGYLWPGGLDDSSQLGARNLPENVRNSLQEIGHLIID